MKCFADSVGVFWIGHPAVILSFFTSARVNCDNGLTLEAAGWDTWHGSLSDNGAETIFCINGGLAAFFFIGDINQNFDKAALGSFGDVIGEGVDDDIAFGPEERLVVSRVIEVASEAGIVPEKDSYGTVGFIAGGCDHAVEVIATNS